LLGGMKELRPVPGLFSFWCDRGRPRTENRLESRSLRTARPGSHPYRQHLEGAKPAGRAAGQVCQHIDAQPLRVEFAGLGKLHDFRDDQLGNGVFAIAVELQHVANPIKGCAHRFEKLGVSVEFREWHGGLRFEDHCGARHLWTGSGGSEAPLASRSTRSRKQLASCSPRRARSMMRTAMVSLAS
jgi:hypothetical protein